IHEGYRYPTKFDDKGKLPDTKKLAGIKSKEYPGSGYNQLRFDDTTNQISSQLHSSHGATQLNLGNLSHPKETETSEGRGEGFELRTDQWGAVRAGQGLLLSTHTQDEASGNHLDTTEAKSQLENSLNNTKALSEVAKHQQTDPLEVLNNLKHFLNQIEKGEKDKADAFKQALMLLASPNSIAMSTNSDLHLSADGQISQSAGNSINLSSQKNLIAHAKNKISLFAAQEGARLYAAKGKVEIKAHSDGADLIARKGIQIISTEDTIYMISPKEIVFRADTSELRLNGSGIFSTTPGLFEVKSGQQLFKEGTQFLSEIKTLPQAPTEYSLKFHYVSNLPDQLGSKNKNLTLGKELFVVEKKDNKLIQKYLLNERKDNQYSFSERFYTSSIEDVSAILFMSNDPHLFFNQDDDILNEIDFNTIDEDDSIIAEADKK
ncbi:DUF2345 domain-containing protein, partial [Acinetobacter bereziniae]|uniref:DUF2345 domain-containing protein n=2 Tax=Acinetobacter bereziniae TaxID=106648 RepID=UPI001D0DE3A5